MRRIPVGEVSIDAPLLPGLALRGALAGSAIGVAGAVAAGRALSVCLFRITPADLPTLLLVIAVLGVVSLRVSCLAARIP